MYPFSSKLVCPTRSSPCLFPFPTTPRLEGTCICGMTSTPEKKVRTRGKCAQAVLSSQSEWPVNKAPVRREHRGPSGYCAKQTEAYQLKSEVHPTSSVELKSILPPTFDIFVTPFSRSEAPQIQQSLRKDLSPVISCLLMSSKF